jgi:hypothetical protein
MVEKTITEFLNDEYKSFAMYSIESRAIPSLIDGFKIRQRKIIHVSNGIWKNGSEKNIKVFQLAGKVAADCYYHHGNCLDGESEIILDDGSFIKIKDWFIEYPDVRLNVVSFNEEDSTFVSGIGHSPRIGQVTNLEYEIEMDDGYIFKCTENHPFLTKRGWIEAKDLLPSDDIVSLNDFRGENM